LKYGTQDSLRISLRLPTRGAFPPETIPGTQGRVQDIRENASPRTPKHENQTPTQIVWQEKLKAIRGDAVALAEMWGMKPSEANFGVSRNG